MTEASGDRTARRPDSVWLEQTLRIPLGAYPQVRRLLGELATTYGVEVGVSPDVRINGQPVSYNERKVIWVDDIGGTRHRPMIPFSQLMDRANVSDGMAAMTLASAIRHEAGRALEAGERSDLLPYVHSEPAPSEWFQYDVQGLYADRALELAYGGEVLERIPGISPLGVKLFREFCVDLVQPAQPPVQ